MSATRVLHVYDGRRRIGELRDHFLELEAFDADGRSLGRFVKRVDAVSAIDRADRAPRLAKRRAAS